ncbi:MAG: hypothetical protein ACPGXL_09920 [Chitinophagales bacterium]
MNQHCSRSHIGYFTLMPFTYLICFFLLSSHLLTAQTPSTILPANSEPPATISIFLDCGYSCDMDFIRQEVPYLQYVINPQDADVHILVARQNTGSGGDAFDLNAIGQKLFAEQKASIQFFTTNDVTPNERNEALVKNIQLLLMPYLIQTKLAEKLTIGYTTDDTNANESTEEAENDPWRNWVIGLNLNGHSYAEAAYQSGNLWSGIDINKITEDWKYEIGYTYSLNQSKYLIDDEEYKNTISNHRFNIRSVKSINDHWSVGTFANVRSSTYQNYLWKTSFYPAVEYNLFPYSESARKQLRMAYEVGYTHNNYIDTTIYDKIEEGFWTQNIGIALQTQQKWGSISGNVRGTHYLNQPSLYRFNVFGRINWRIVKGLSINLSGGYSHFNDQVNLSKGNYTASDILIGSRQLSTRHEYWVNYGIRYNIGSKFNNVVNPRFGNN